MKKRIFDSGSSWRWQKASSSSTVCGVCTRRFSRTPSAAGAACTAAADACSVCPTALLRGISAPQKLQKSSPGLTGAPQAGQVFLDIRNTSFLSGHRWVRQERIVREFVFWRSCFFAGILCVFQEKTTKSGRKLSARRRGRTRRCPLRQYTVLRWLKSAWPSAR